MAQMHVSKDRLPPERVGDYQWRMTQLGSYYVRFESIPAGFDDAEFLKGLPDDACQCEHWGYLFKGTMRFRYTDGHEQVVSGGEAYYARPGHSFEVLEDCETVEFSPKEAFDRLMEVVGKNVEAMGQRIEAEGQP